MCVCFLHFIPSGPNYPQLNTRPVSTAELGTCNLMIDVVEWMTTSMGACIDRESNDRLKVVVSVTITTRKGSFCVGMTPRPISCILIYTVCVRAGILLVNQSKPKPKINRFGYKWKPADRNWLPNRLIGRKRITEKGASEIESVRCKAMESSRIK